jgi:hypothetical protein
MICQRRQLWRFDPTGICLIPLWSTTLAMNVAAKIALEQQERELARKKIVRARFGQSGVLLTRSGSARNHYQSHESGRSRTNQYGDSANCGSPPRPNPMRLRPINNSRPRSLTLTSTIHHCRCPRTVMVGLYGPPASSRCFHQWVVVVVGHCCEQPAGGTLLLESKKSGKVEGAGLRFWTLAAAR